MIPEDHRDFVEQLQRDNDISDPITPPPWQPSVGADLLQRTRGHIEVTIEERVPIFASGLGNPAVILEQAHEVGTKVWGLVGMTRQARRELEAGVDLIIAQGGHSGRIGIFSLVPAVARMSRGYDTPVLAAGGVTGGEHLVAALALGAVGVWCGTIWQATTESHIAPFLKDKLVKAATEDSSKSRSLTGKPAARLRSEFIDAWEQPDAPPTLAMPLQSMLVAKIVQAIEDHHIEDFMNVAAGQGVGLIDEIRPTAQVIADMVREAKSVLQGASA
jgi:NAD(P)H-dependent flavin oxidoreductase YrpB (nitropropane dioxygenase family)